MKFLYICTHNRCRSILCEAITNHEANGLLEARSAGSAPAGEVHPWTLRALREAGIPVTDLRSQSWDELASFEPDLIITVCDSAAGESCPLWFGQTPRLHWGLKDPSAHGGDDEEVAQAFRATIELIREHVARLRELASLPRHEWLPQLTTLGATAHD